MYIIIILFTNVQRKFVDWMWTNREKNDDTLSSSATVRRPYNTAHFPPTSIKSPLAVK